MKTMKQYKISLANVVLVAVLVLGAYASPKIEAQTGQAAAEERTSAGQGVTIKVVPKAIGPADSRWEFGVVFDTHSAELNDDVSQSAVLVTDDGRTLKPAGWTGAAPGGHHREGVLLFDAPAPRPGSIELRITRPGESAPRSFRWQL
jgi:hypothetical protein